MSYVLAGTLRLPRCRVRRTWSRQLAAKNARAPASPNASCTSSLPGPSPSQRGCQTAQTTTATAVNGMSRASMSGHIQAMLSLVRVGTSTATGRAMGTAATRISTWSGSTGYGLPRLPDRTRCMDLDCEGFSDPWPRGHSNPGRQETGSGGRFVDQEPQDVEGRRDAGVPVGEIGLDAARPRDGDRVVLTHRQAVGPGALRITTTTIPSTPLSRQRAAGPDLPSRRVD